MNVELTRALATRPGAAAESDSGWQLNQSLRAQVMARTSDGGTLLNIDGRLFHARTQAQLQQGDTLQLQIKSLAPRLELAITESFRLVAANVPQPATTLSVRLSQQNRAIKEASVFQLTRLLQAEQSGNLSLPVDTTNLLKQLRRALLRPRELASPASLKPALQNSGLWLEQKLIGSAAGDAATASEVEDDLKANLLRLLGNLRQYTGPIRGRPVLAGQYGLQLYRELSPQYSSLLLEMACDTEELLQRIGNNQQLTLQQSEGELQRWHMELPLNHAAQPQAVPITVSREPNPDTPDAEEPVWGASFCLNLAHRGQINARIQLRGKTVSISLDTARAETVQQLQRRQDELVSRLQEGGLNLRRFDSRVSDSESAQESA